MSMIREILQAMVAERGHIEVVRGSITAREYIYVCRPDGRVLLAGDLPREMLDQLLKQSFVYKHGEENERCVATYHLTPDGEKAGTKERH
jgi:hypothetical protein